MRVRQTEFRFRTWGGKRPGSGPKRTPARIGLLRHGERPAFDARVPALVTLRGVAGVPNFRAERVAGVILAEIRRVSAKGFRVVHFSIQSNHLHLIVEADDGPALSRGMQRLGSRVALAINLLLARRGTLWRDRYHRRDLPKPRQFRNALVYVLFNARKHAQGTERARRMRVLDGRSSAIWTDHWAVDAGFLDRIRSARAGPAPVVPPVTWMARRGWLRHGRLRLDEVPRSADA
jgi:REP element-mobilizing transposase RayT